MDVDAHRLADTRARTHEPSTGLGKERSQRSQYDPGDDRDQHGTPEHRLLLQLVAPSEGLRDQARRSRAQKVEGGEDQVERQRAGGKAAEQRGVAELADHRRVDNAEKRRRQIGERHRHGDGQHRSVGDDEMSRGGLGRSLVQGLLPG